ncbi:MAG: diguanylate cyclase [Candidatus Sericytochromatia bacterium]|nr:diguanylate cyclase [Candidatus Sericytochromatia bacterium]
MGTEFHAAASRVVPAAEGASGDALERMLYILSALGEMAEQMTANPNPESSIRAIIRMASGAFGIGRGALLVYRPEAQLLESVGGEGGPPLEVSADVRRWFLAEGGTVVDREHPHEALVDFLQANAPAVEAYPPSIWLPLTVNRTFMGLLMLGDRLSREPLSRVETDILMLIGRQLAVALHNHALKSSISAANLKLGLKVRQLEQLYDISRDLSSSLDRGRIAREVMVRAIELLDARKGVLVLPDEAGLAHESAAIFGFEERDEGFSWPAEASWLAPAWEARGPLLLEADALPAELGARNAMLAPIRYQDRTFGVVAVLDHEARQQLGAFDLEEAGPLLANLASLAATAMENARLYELATVDGLTRLYIRRHFEQRLVEELRRAERYGLALSLMIMDIDHFKRFNDTYGHQQGDEVLRHVARTVRASIRDLDTPGRYGGEELLVLMPETDGAGAEVMAERVRQAIEGAGLLGPAGEDLRVTVSVGVATWPRDARDAEAMIEAADRALYRAKAAGRNRTCAANG